MPFAISITSDPYRGISSTTPASNINSSQGRSILGQSSENIGDDIEQPRGMPSWMLTPPTGAARVGSTLQHAESIVAQDGASAAASFLHDPKNVALLASGAAVIAGAQLVPGVGEAVDLAAGVAGVAMYAAAGPEHRPRITQAVGELRSYLSDVSSARSQSDLDRAPGHLARFMELGGTEASQGLLAIAGAASAPARFAELAKGVASSGGLAGIAEQVNGFVHGVGNGLGRLGNGGLTPAYAGGNVRIAEMRAVAPPRGGSVGAVRGSFDVDEVSGGHAKSRHIGKSDECLWGRLVREPNIEASSTFTNEAVAAKAIGVFLKQEGSAVSQWAKNPKGAPVFTKTVTADFPVGRVLDRGERAPRTSKTFFVQLTKDNSSRGWHINTAYPK